MKMKGELPSVKMEEAVQEKRTLDSHLAEADKRKAWLGAAMVASMVGDAETKAKKKEELKVKFEEFCTDTSVSAITRAYQAKNSLKRYTWVVLFLGALSIITLQTYYIVSKYFSYPSETIIQLAFEQEMDFPAVTVCNLNPIRKSAIMRPDSPFHDFKDDPDPMKDPLLSKMRTQLSALQSGSGSGGTTAGQTPQMVNTAPSGGGTGTTGAGGGSGTTGGSGSTSMGGGWTTKVASHSVTSGSGAAHTSTNAPPSSGSPPKGKRKRRSSDDDEEEFNRWDMLKDSATAAEFYEKKNDRFEKEKEFAEKVAAIGVEQLADIGHQIEDFISDCSWSGFPCSPSNFTIFQNYKYGNCFTFNSANDSATLKTKRAGSLYGLHLEIFIEQGEYLPQFSPEAGVRVVIHKPHTMPFPEDEGFNVAPGASTALGIKSTHVTRLPDPWGDCVASPNRATLYNKEYGTQYTKTACVKSCFQENVVARCGCAMAEYPIPANVSVCNASNEVHEKCEEDVTELHKKKALGCDTLCKLPCNDKEYEVMVSQSVWPSLAYSKQLEKKLEFGSKKMKQHAGKSSSKDHMVKIEVYYREMTYQKIVQQESYAIANLLSDIGGTLGLWLGLSVISVCEFLEFLVSVFSFARYKRKEAEKVKKTPVTEISLPPGGVFGPLQ